MAPTIANSGWFSGFFSAKKHPQTASKQARFKSENSFVNFLTDTNKCREASLKNVSVLYLHDLSNYEFTNTFL